MRQKKESTKKNVKLRFGECGDKIVCIDEVQRGDACRCVCPQCGGALIAKKGEHNAWHFAHKNAECDIVIVNETALHKLAKDILAEEKKILFPQGIVYKEEVVSKKDIEQYYGMLSPYKTYPGKKIFCDAVMLENRVSDIVPDIVVESRGRKCLIEIAVTHCIDDEKMRKIQEIGLPVVEVYLKDFYKHPYTREEIKEAVLYQADNRKWVFNPWIKEWARQQYEEEIKSAIEEKRKEENRVKKEEQRRKKAKQQLNRLFEPSKYRAKIMELRDDASVRRMMPKYKFFNACKGKIPFYVDIPITGEFVFSCDRRIWQGAIFEKFIYRRRVKNEPVFIDMERIRNYFVKHAKKEFQIKIDWRFTYRTYIACLGREVSLLWNVIRQYLRYLEKLGFLSFLDKGSYLLESAGTITPPNAEMADNLKEILLQVDNYAPAIDRIIEKELAVQADVIRSNYKELSVQEPFNQADRRECVMQDSVISTESSKVKKNQMFLQRELEEYLCERCNRVYQGSEMAWYGGKDKGNTGVCRKCNREASKNKSQ